MSARPHFSIAGIPVHVQPVFFIVAGLMGLRYVDFGLDVVGMWVLGVFISILVHELGHGIAFRVFGRRPAIVLHAFGGVTLSPRGTALTRSRSIVVSVAGALTALLVLWLPSRQLLGGTWLFEQPTLLIWLVYFLAFQNLWWSLFNLLPIRPLDGGNVAADLFGLDAARRTSIGAAAIVGIWSLFNDQGFMAFFALFLALNNWQELRAAQTGGDLDAFQVDAPDPGGGTRSARAHPGRGHLTAVPMPPLAAAPDPARAEQLAWAALREGDSSRARQLTTGLGSGANPFLEAAVALSSGDTRAFELFERAYVAQPGGPPNLVATELLARTGAAVPVARRLVERSDGKGRDGAATLQTHLHYADHFEAAAQVGEAVFAAGPASRAQTAFEIACSWAKAGDVDRAAEWLEQAADAGFRAASVVDGEPDLAAVRALPQWPLLRARLA